MDQMCDLSMQKEDKSRFLRFESSKLDTEDDVISDIQLNYDNLIDFLFRSVL